LKLIEICYCQNISLRIPESYHFTLTNSPYYAHLNFSAVDIYPPIGESIVLSPFDGILVFYKKLHEEHICGFKADTGYIRVLHVKPIVKEGEKVCTGDVLGELQHSPTFRPWTDYHAHIEIRFNKEFIRARGGQKLRVGNDIITKLRSSTQDLVLNLNNTIIEGRIYLIRREKYIIIKPKHYHSGYLSPIIVDINGLRGFLEGGIPYYRHGGVLINEYKDTKINVVMGGKPLGYVNKVYEHYLHITPYNIEFHIGKLPLKGISLYINFRYIKAIPKSWEYVDLSEGDEVELTLSNPEGHT